MPVPSFTTGEVLTASAMNTVGLWKLGDFSATSGTTLTCDNVFSSNYASYKVVMSDARLANAAIVTVQLRTTTTTNTGYAFGRVEIPYNSTLALGRDGSGTGTGSAWFAIVGDTNSNGGWLEIHNPNLSRQTSYNFMSADPRTGGTFGTEVGGGIQTATTQFTGLIFTAGATITNMNVRIYGYRN